MTIHQNLIAGEWVGKQGSENINPSDTKNVVGVYAQASADDAKAAIAAAKAAFPAWSRSGILERHAILKKTADEILARKEELGRLLSQEEGKTLPEGIGETIRAAQIFDFFAGETLRLAGEVLPSARPNIGVEITREPLGPIGIITPWNFPIAIPAWKIAPALAYGNTVVFKPADLVPGCSWAIVDILHRAGLPKGVLNLVMGRGSVVGQAMLDSPDLAGITFTGSTGTGKRVALSSIEHNRKFQLEMGGKNPMVVLMMQIRRCCRSGCQFRLLLHGPALHCLFAPHRHGRYSRQVRGCFDRTFEQAERRSRAQGWNAYWPGGR